ncbi:uncharacterized protein LOC109852395 isoform X2 [Pseudomyrmex gracilis]|uniref:uncharacterized protein LOC109852395 isoform X2 n=1 Tax=Pseudomyrmex gracilis TaxID=219809 RepID=UPI0009951835|nr:uncharacterized protein LOC109852395 isoform X2 [Pseudomyrmex gracilis]XP_020279102.1 uncharacterized protein LOC109852395 isoform X2 [Pseudomyrmex gracilis]XP_020279103.1 uncharacterized protein LOC109852395 isoform X2 [Pseudomyrmex gracilis]
MGMQNSKRQDAGDDIISQKSLNAVKELIHFLKNHSTVEGLFRRAGRRELRQHILNSLKKGQKPHFEDSNNAALECAAALQIFLSRLKKPIMPQHVQELILADNPGVEAQVIAQDALGLIRQDVSGRHGELLTGVLDLLRHLTLSGSPSECSELRGSPLPIALLPVFFNLSPSDLMKWKQVAARFSELITEAAMQLHRDEQRAVRTETVLNSTASPSSEEESEELTRLQELSLLYPIVRLTNHSNASHVGEIARLLITPLQHPAVSRLHPAIVNRNRQ